MKRIGRRVPESPNLILVEDLIKPEVNLDVETIEHSEPKYTSFFRWYGVIRSTAQHYMFRPIGSHQVMVAGIELGHL